MGKVGFLESQLKETETRADAAERMHAVLTNFIMEYKTEIDAIEKKTAAIEDQMVEMDDLADDPNYDLSKKYGKTAAAPAPAPLTASNLASKSAMFNKQKPDEDEVSASSRSSSR